MKKAIEIPVKPLSVNEAWKGRRYKSASYSRFEILLYAKLLHTVRPNIPDGDLEIHFVWGFSRFRQSDYDNPIKTAQDVICRWLKIDDSRFVSGSQLKVKVDKGDEFIRFFIRKFDMKEWTRRMNF